MLSGEFAGRWPKQKSPGFQSPAGASEHNRQRRDAALHAFSFRAYGAISMHLFIDTNVFLSFFHYSNESLEELRKLIALVKTSKVTLHLPEQVKDEFYRNRDTKIADALQKLKDEKVTENFPQICQEYEEYQELRKVIEAYNKTKDALLKKIKEDFKQEQFKADDVIKKLFLAADKIKVSDDIFDKAKLRYELGNPPGKKGSLGDAINWECLLENVPRGTDLYFIANDGDYFSKTNNKNFSHFLEKEWAKKKRGEILLYRQLSVFFKEQFPEIKLADDYERDFWIKSLQTSSNFTETHMIVRRLSRYRDLTSTQLNDVVTAATTNDQVYRIIQDDDINQYICKLISGREDEIEETNLKGLYDLLDAT
jgi:predicted nucleic acid-binding protein